MGYFGDTKHKKVLRKSKKQWITVGLTSAALGLAGLVQTSEFVSAEENPEVDSLAGQVVPDDQAEVSDQEQATGDQAEAQVEALLNTYIERFNQGQEDDSSLYAAFASDVSAIEGADVSQAVDQLAQAVANQVAQANQDQKGQAEESQGQAWSGQAPAESHTGEGQEGTDQAEETEPSQSQASLDQAPQGQDKAKQANVESQSQAPDQDGGVQPQVVTFAAPPQADQVKDPDLDAHLGEPRHVDGTPMEERQVDIELNQAYVQDALEEHIRDFRRQAYDANFPFRYEDYDRPDGANPNTNRLQTAAREAGFYDRESYANGFQWSDRLEDYAIQRATELLTTGYHSGNYSHYRPDRHDNNTAGRRVQHQYISANGEIDHSAPENIHALNDDDIHTAFHYWAPREIENLRRVDGSMKYGGQSVTTTHIHSILNPVHTIFGGASVQLAEGSGVNADRANVLIASKWDDPAHGHEDSGYSRQGTYRVTVQTKQGGPKLPGEADPNAQTPVEDKKVAYQPIPFQTQENFNPDLAVGAVETVQEGQEGWIANGVTVKEAVDKLVEYGPEEKTEEFETKYEVNFELDLGESNIRQEGQKGVAHYNPLTGDLVKVLSEKQDKIVEVGAYEGEVPYDTIRRPVVGLDQERLVQIGSAGTAYFDSEGNLYETDRNTAPQDEIIEYPAEARPVPYAKNRIPSRDLQLGESKVIQTGQPGLAYYDEEGNKLDVPENVDPTTEIIAYGYQVQEFEPGQEENPGQSRTAKPEPAGQSRAAKPAPTGQNRAANPAPAGQSRAAKPEPSPKDLDDSLKASQAKKADLANKVVEANQAKKADLANKVAEANQVKQADLASKVAEASQAQDDADKAPVKVEKPSKAENIDLENKAFDKQASAEKVKVEKPEGNNNAEFPELAELLQALHKGQIEQALKGYDRAKVQAWLQAQEEENSQLNKEEIAALLQALSQIQEGQADSAEDQVKETSDLDKVLADAEDLLAEFNHLVEAEKAQILKALQASQDAAKLDALIEAAYELNLARANASQVTPTSSQAESSQASKQAEEEKAESSEPKQKQTESSDQGQKLPATATSAWALGLVGVTTLVSGLGIKKFKD
ncbi:Putative surface protein SA2285 precursor [Alloiococcus otitis]|uniref:KxYKxGKxW signal peptide n=1 Tax=Alloiococcus otitis ATCC 51267 TaxID=883081 RepID=K9ESM3_9LACT|nr:G5 domain-containing protein [Alloiococcus otitis]EKU93937.1 KxYKxGKxW signal peptide [Alloiococcus otitis ATCC 51267]SUU81657.1 Putative surface protein SA2285 precursor [Alloiococcus otitis]